MTTQKKILIIHPEGNLNFNPNLIGIVEILCEKGYAVDVRSPKKYFSQIVSCTNSRMLLHNEMAERIKSRIINVSGQYRIANKICKVFYRDLKHSSYDLVIGVDRQGIIDASIIADFLKVPYGLISYEIFFEEETGKRIKEIEKEACKNVSFAVCQDNLRSKHLATENNIPLEKIINIPVAGRQVKQGIKTEYLSKKLHIEYGKKIALLAGQIADWTMLKEIIDGLPLWPDDWAVVLHNRYGGAEKKLQYNRDADMPSNLHFSTESLPDIHMMSQLLNSVDLGIAFYKPKKGNAGAGCNLKYIGMSSGKIATYLQHGLPVMINDIGIMSEYVKKYDLGFVINEMGEIPKTLQGFSRDYYRERCYTFFRENLDLDNTINSFLKAVEEIVG